jgi:small redox-active disulfide protein 2
MDIKVLGPGCRNCRRLADHVDQALASAGISATVEKVEDIERLVSFGVTSTPALMVDGEVVMAGRVPAPSQIVELLRARA